MVRIAIACALLLSSGAARAELAAHSASADRLPFGLHDADLGRVSIVFCDYNGNPLRSDSHCIKWKGDGELSETWTYGPTRARHARVSRERLIAYLRLAEQLKLFSLEDFYDDPRIIDGSLDIFTIELPGHRKSITLKNAAPPQIHRLDKELSKVVAATFAR